MTMSIDPPSVLFCKIVIVDLDHGLQCVHTLAYICKVGIGVVTPLMVLSAPQQSASSARSIPCEMLHAWNRKENGLFKPDPCKCELHIIRVIHGRHNPGNPPDAPVNLPSSPVFLVNAGDSSTR